MIDQGTDGVNRARSYHQILSVALARIAVRNRQDPWGLEFTGALYQGTACTDGREGTHGGATAGRAEARSALIANDAVPSIWRSRAGSLAMRGRSVCGLAKDRRHRGQVGPQVRGERCGLGLGRHGGRHDAAAARVSPELWGDFG